MGSLARALIVALALDGAARVVSAGDDAARRARAALALARPPAPAVKADTAREARAAAALADACTCSAARAMPYAEAAAKSLAGGRVLVGFFGGTPVRCCFEAIPGTLPSIPAGYDPAKPIVVFAPTARGLLVVAELAADAPASTVKAAVAAARKQLGQ